MNDGERTRTRIITCNWCHCPDGGPGGGCTTGELGTRGMKVKTVAEIIECARAHGASMVEPMQPMKPLEEES